MKKGFRKQTKTIEDQGRNNQGKKIEALKVLKLDAEQLTIKNAIPQEQLNEEAKNEKMRKWKKWKKGSIEKIYIFEINKHIYNFQNF